MGRVAGATGRRDRGPLTRWAFIIDALPPFVGEPLALVVTEEVAASWSHGSLPITARCRRSALRRLVLGALVRRATGTTRSPVLAARPDGVRYLAGTDLYVSVAHRDDWVAAALARHPVGIDLEDTGEAARAAAVILDGVEAGIDHSAWHGLAGIWAAREAVLKAQGLDLSHGHRSWRFGDRIVTPDDRSSFRVDLVGRASIVAAVAYAGR